MICFRGDPRGRAIKNYLGHNFIGAFLVNKQAGKVLQVTNLENLIKAKKKCSFLHDCKASAFHTGTTLNSINNSLGNADPFSGKLNNSQSKLKEVSYSSRSWKLILIPLLSIPSLGLLPNPINCNDYKYKTTLKRIPGIQNLQFSSQYLPTRNSDVAVYLCFSSLFMGKTE
jgi:hypothetical protein